MAIKWAKVWAQEILKSPVVRADMRARADRVAAAAGNGFESGSSVGKNRARAYVLTASNTARRENARQNTLLKALEAGRGN